MATATGEVQPFRRAMLLMTATSFLVPAAGVLTAPILARALGTGGRGELAAAQAPAALMLAVATLGLPDALTFLLAKRPGLTRAALAWASVITCLLGGLCVLVTWLALPFLSAGVEGLGALILLASAFTIPALIVGVLRGAATGRQMWGAVAVERLLTTALRVLGLGGLWMLDHLTVLTALIVGALTSVVAGLAYWRLLLPSRAGRGAPPLEGDEGAGLEAGMARSLVSFGSKVWVGSIASMLLARMGQIFMAPLSSVEDLGLYTVATTISDVPLIVALALQSALYGVNSRSMNAPQLAKTTRVALLVGFAGCTVLGVTLPLWIGPLFGGAFVAATVPTIMLLISAVLCIPGLLAASGVAAWGRPGLRSLGLTITLATNAVAFVLLVPAYGVYGACWTSILNNLVLTTFMVFAASRVMDVPVTSFFAVRGSDVRLARDEALRLCRRLIPQRWARTPAHLPVADREAPEPSDRSVSG